MKVGLGLDGWWLVVFHNIEILKGEILSTRFSLSIHSNFCQVKTLIFFVVFFIHINIPPTLITCQVHVRFLEGATLQVANISSNEVGLLEFESDRLGVQNTSLWILLPNVWLTIGFFNDEDATSAKLHPFVLWTRTLILNSLDLKCFSRPIELLCFEISMPLEDLQILIFKLPMLHIQIKMYGSNLKVS